MNTLPAVHLCIVQPVGYVHSLGLLDQANFFRYQFERLGATVTLGKNRLHNDAMNFVFGAHLGFDQALLRKYDCFFVNLEQIGEGGANLPADYLKLISMAPAVDYDLRNARAYSNYPNDVPLVSFQYAPYLEASSIALEERPIDLLFFGSVNPRRQQWISRIEACGLNVSTFDGALYGPERDHFIAQSKAVLNCHFYDSSRFEQARAFTCLSLGTPLISEIGAATQVPAAFAESVSWVKDAELERFFTESFATPAWFAASRARLEAFRHTDPIEAYADLLAFAVGYRKGRGRDSMPVQRSIVNRVHIGSGKDYKPGWLNLDVLESALPDVVLDLAKPLSFPHDIDSIQVGSMRLAAGEVETIYANNVLEHVPDLPMLMRNCLDLLKVGGEFVIEVPHERARTAWQDPTHVRAMNDNSWLYYTDWFWYLGWFEHRFLITQYAHLNEQVQPCEPGQAAFMRVVLTKVETTLQERMRARTLRADFGPGVGHSLHSPAEPVLATEVAEGHAESHADGRIGVRLPAF
jgi:SAM-dependent methyltransferase